MYLYIIKYDEEFSAASSIKSVTLVTIEPGFVVGRTCTVFSSESNEIAEPIQTTQIILYTTGTITYESVLSNCSIRDYTITVADSLVWHDPNNWYVPQGQDSTHSLEANTYFRSPLHPYKSKELNNYNTVVHPIMYLSLT